MTTKNAARVVRKRVGRIWIVLIIHCNVVLVQSRDLERVLRLFVAGMSSERVLKISRAVLRSQNKLLGCTARRCWGGAAGFVVPRLQISLEYAPSSRLAIRSAALAIPSRSILKTRSKLLSLCAV